MTPWTIAQPGSPVLGILQARILEWVAIPFSRVSSWPRDRTQASCTVGEFFTVWTTHMGSPIHCQVGYNVSLPSRCWKGPHFPAGCGLRNLPAMWCPPWPLTLPLTFHKGGSSSQVFLHPQPRPVLSLWVEVVCNLTILLRKPSLCPDRYCHV